MSKEPESLGFYATPEHECSYLPGRKATTLFADPDFPKNRVLYSSLAGIGFRRSGEHVYQPYCRNCTACVPIRIPVRDFRANRNQRRNWKRNRDLTCHIKEALFSEEHFNLYQRYIHSRHAGGGMDNPDADNYMKFLTASWADTLFLEFRHQGALVAVSVVDMMDDALSAVYTFFEPDEYLRSPGRYAILYEIELACQYRYQWLYLGYWINECRKMNYKSEYLPNERFADNRWERYDSR